MEDIVFAPFRSAFVPLSLVGNVGIVSCHQTPLTDMAPLTFFHNGTKISGECGSDIHFLIGKLAILHYASGLVRVFF